MSAISTDFERHSKATARAPWALASLAMTMLLSSLGTSIANVGLPTLARAFDSSLLAVQWVVLAYLLAVTSLVLIAGKLGDLFGRRRLLLVGISLFAVASIACGSATQLEWLIAARVLQGAGAALMMAMSMALVGASVSKERVGRALGLLGTMSAVGTALGPALGGLLLRDFAWQSIFLINLPLAACAYLFVRRYVPCDLTSNERPRFDYLGSILLMVALVSYALAMTSGGKLGVVNLALLAGALLMFGLFAVVQTRSAAPLVQPELFRSPSLRRGFVISVLASSVAMSTLVIGPFYLVGALNLGSAETGLVMATGPLFAALVGVPAGWGVDRWGSGRMLIVGLSAMAFGSFAMALVAAEQGVLGYIGPLLLLTAGFSTFQAANNTALLATANATQRGVVSGLLNLSRNLGFISGAAALSAVFVWVSGVVDFASAERSDVLAGTHSVFAVATGLVVLAWMISVLGEMRAQT